MLDQFSDVDQRLALCGYGVPELEIATACARQRATVIVEDEMPNAVLAPVPDAADQTRKERRIKFFRFPIPDDVLLAAAGEGDVELRITLSYFAEPTTTRRRERLGLELAFDVQGAQESEGGFRERMNLLMRPKPKPHDLTLTPASSDSGGTSDEADELETTSQLDDREGAGPRSRSRDTGFARWWQLGMKRRSRGTVQSDRLTCPASLLAGSKLIAVTPRLGWWDDRHDTVCESMRFSLIVTLIAPGRDIYSPISQALDLSIRAVQPAVDVTIAPQAPGT